MIEQLMERWTARQKAWRFIPVTRFPSVLDYYDDVVFQGAFSWSIRNRRERFVDEHEIITPYGVPVTPGEVARDYLHVKYPKRGWLKRSQWDSVSVHRSAPLYAIPTHIEYGYYVDIKSAYWSIVRAVGWDVDYYPSNWIAQRSSNADFPASQYKLARSLLVTTATMGKAVQWHYGHFQIVPVYNPLLNPAIYALVMDVLHGIASDMIETGAIYVHTDGYIIPHSRLDDAFLIASTWGLELGVKYEGEVNVYGAGRYEFTGQSRKLKEGEKSTGIVASIDAHDKQWLRGRFARLARLNSG